MPSAITHIRYFLSAAGIMSSTSTCQTRGLHWSAGAVPAAGASPDLGGEERGICRLEVQEGEGGVPRPQVRGPGGGDAGEGGAGEGVRGARNGACGCPQLLDGGAGEGRQGVVRGWWLWA